MSRWNACVENATRIKSLSTCMQANSTIHPICDNGMPLCTCMKKASLTLEAAVVYPFITAFWVYLLLFFRVLQIQTDVQAALSYAGRETAAIAVSTDSEQILLMTAKRLWKQAIEDSERIEDYVHGGMKGISFTGSEITDEDICLHISYRLELPFSFFPGLGYSVAQSQICHKWIGETGEGTESEDPYVYITDSGTAYHTTASCHYLDLSIQTVNLSDIAAQRNRDDHKYYACPHCVAKNTTQKEVYITDYGELYHTDEACTALRRHIRMVHLSEVGSRKMCSKCAQESE